MLSQAKIKTIGDALVNGFTVNGTPTLNVYHYWRPKMQAPFIVWAESDGRSDLQADNKKAEQEIAGYIDYFTLREYDPNIDKIQEILNSINNVAFYWRLDSADYEDETNLIHYSWEWVLA